MPEEISVRVPKNTNDETAKQSLEESVKVSRGAFLKETL